VTIVCPVCGDTVFSGPAIYHDKHEGTDEVVEDSHTFVSSTTVGTTFTWEIRDVFGRTINGGGIHTC
jgi:hypothetical protein